MHDIIPLVEKEEVFCESMHHIPSSLLNKISYGYEVSMLVPPIHEESYVECALESMRE